MVKKKREHERKRRGTVRALRKKERTKIIVNVLRDIR
jgi:hypothetical protein